MSEDSKNPLSTLLAELFRGLSQPTRIDILLAIGTGEACVCHLETILGLRQAYISQHLMAMRDAGVITSRREGRFIYYRIVDKNLFAMLRDASACLGMDREAVVLTTGGKPLANCNCPKCTNSPMTLIPPEAVLRQSFNPRAAQDQAS